MLNVILTFLTGFLFASVTLTEYETLLPIETYIFSPVILVPLTIICFLTVLDL